MRRIVAVVVLLVLGTCSLAQTSIPTLMNYQGRLTATSGAPLPDGQYKLTFRLFGQLSGGIQTWYQTMDPVVVRNGVFAVLLGSGAPLTEAMFTGTTFLEVQVGDAAPLTPRQPIVSVAYAMKAERAKVADTVPTGSIGTAVIADGAVTTPKLADGSVTTPKIADGSVTTPKIAAGAVASDKVGDGAITSQKIAASAVTEPAIADSSVGRRAISGDQTALDKMTAGALGIYNGGDVQIGQNRFMGLYPSAESFTYDGKRMGNYALGWFSDSWSSDAPSLWLAGYGGMKLFTSNIPALSIDLNGNVSIHGNLTVRGTSKNRVIATKTYGDRAMYAFESTENRFLDQGRARLRNGSATIKLDPMFLQTVEGDYLIHLTPYADASLYVARTGRGAFTVKCRRGDRNAQFVWQLSAWSKGGKGMRMREVGARGAGAQP